MRGSINHIFTFFNQEPGTLQMNKKWLNNSNCGFSFMWKYYRLGLSMNILSWRFFPCSFYFIFSLKQWITFELLNKDWKDLAWQNQWNITQCTFRRLAPITCSQLNWSRFRSKSAGIVWLWASPPYPRNACKVVRILRKMGWGLEGGYQLWKLINF